MKNTEISNIPQGSIFQSLKKNINVRIPKNIIHVFKKLFKSFCLEQTQCKIVIFKIATSDQKTDDNFKRKKDRHLGPNASSLSFRFLPTFEERDPISEKMS